MKSLFCRKRIWSILLWAFLILPLNGCRGIDTDTKIVLTTGFKEDEVFKIETASCYKWEVMVYLTNIQNQYEDVYGQEIWNVNRDGVTLEGTIKNSVLAQLARIKTMNLMAKNHKVELSKEELAQVEEAAGIYFESLNEVEKSKLNITLENIQQIYKEYAIANKVYQYLISDVNPEISDDEARRITVEQIFVRTSEVNSQGESVPFTPEQKEKAYSLCMEMIQEIAAGEAFEVVASHSGQGEMKTLSFGKDEMPGEIEEVAFNLGQDEVSDIIETEEGYVILKCVSAFNRDETDANKIKIIEERKKERFSQEYDTYVQTLTRNMNEQVWNQITLLQDDQIRTKELFEVYNQNCNM